MLLVGQQEGHPACKKTERWGAGMVNCLQRGADLHTAQLMPLPLTVSCSSKIQIGFTFLVPAHPGSPGKRAVKWVRCDSRGIFWSIQNICQKLSPLHSSVKWKRIHFWRKSVMVFWQRKEHMNRYVCPSSWHTNIVNELNLNQSTNSLMPNRCGG